MRNCTPRAGDGPRLVGSTHEKNYNRSMAKRGPNLRIGPLSCYSFGSIKTSAAFQSKLSGHTVLSFALAICMYVPSSSAPWSFAPAGPPQSRPLGFLPFQVQCAAVAHYFPEQQYGGKETTSGTLSLHPA